MTHATCVKSRWLFHVSIKIVVSNPQDIGAKLSKMRYTTYTYGQEICPRH
jgi:hypothetical protein